MEASAARCRNARIGSGKGVGTALGLTEDLEIQAFNGPGGSRVELRVIGRSPLEIDGVIEAKLSAQTADPRFGQVLTVLIPAAFTSKIFDTYATLTDFSAKVPVKSIKAGKRKIPYAGLTGCPAEGLTFGYQADYTDGTTRQGRRRPAVRRRVGPECGCANNPLSTASYLHFAGSDLVDMARGSRTDRARAVVSRTVGAPHI